MNSIPHLRPSPVIFDLDLLMMDSSHFEIQKSHIVFGLRFDMRPSKNENEVASIGKTNTKYSFVAPGAIGKGRGRGLKSLSFLGDVAKGRGKGLRYMCSLGVSGMWPTNKNSLVFEKGHMQINIPSFSFTDDAMQYIQKKLSNYGALEKGRGQEFRSMCFLEESENEERSFHQNTHYNCQSMSRPSKSIMSAAQELRTMYKKPLAHDKENMQN
uniref:Uncharacterized protein LOC104214434 n=1 Tax=Nicotiana sylvestris TaxID=4096 RepID=A0A1U7VJ69_NICSY|nr:PREDICTED: uncharacterized protein LOC104214434 [Nicotiana sylvestris]